MGLGSGMILPTESVRVLVVDDSRVIRAVVKSCLRSTGYAVDEAPDGLAALQLCDEQGYDVVVSDVTMPGLDGLGLMHVLDQRADRPEVVLLTAASSDLSREAAQRGMSLGAHETLSKPPAAPDTVVLAVQRALQRKRVRDQGRRAEPTRRAGALSAQRTAPSPVLKATMAS